MHNYYLVPKRFHTAQPLSMFTASLGYIGAEICARAALLLLPAVSWL